MASTRLTHNINSTGDRQKFTFSVWCKRSALGTHALFVSGTESDEAGYFTIYFTSDNLRIRFYEGGVKDVVTSAVYRDTSAWYHVVVKVDTTQATDANRVIIYVNGEEQDKASATYVTQNFNTLVNTSGEVHKLGVQENSQGTDSNFFDGLMTHYHLIDGTAYDASAFGETDATTGIWKPKTAPSVTYGTNGAFLKFENSGAMGTDSSGNGNDYTVLGTMTQTIDTPSNVFATMNPLDKSGTVTFSNGNNTTVIAANNNLTKSTLAVSQGKWYVEIKYDSTSDNSVALGIIDSETSLASIASNGLLNTGYTGVAYYGFNGNKYVNGSSSAYGNSFTTGDIIGIALDLDNNYVYFSKNGTWQNSGDPTSGATGTGGISISNNSYHTTLDNGNPSNTQTVSWNFGNGYFGTTAVSSAQNPDDGIGIFEYDVPTGYRALCTKSINAEEYS